MGIRINKRVKIAPGISINLNKTGASLSLGKAGSMFNIGPQGVRTTIGAPGSGISYVTQKSWGSFARDLGMSGGATGGGSGSGRKSASGGGRRKKADGLGAASPASLPGDWIALPRDERLELSFFERLSLPAREEALIDGCRELLLEKDSAALTCFERAASLADGAFMAGVTALRLGRCDRAVEHLSSAAQRRAQLGRSFERHGFVPQLLIPVTDEIAAVVGPDIRGVLLALSEAYQLLWSNEAALDAVQKLRRLEPGDPVLLLAQIELMLSSRGENKAQLERVLSLSAEVQNDSAAHSAVLLYRARAQRALGLAEAARDTLTAALRKKSARPAELLNAMRYERAEVYSELGDEKKAQQEFERIYAEDPEFLDVAEKVEG